MESVTDEPAPQWATTELNALLYTENRAFRIQIRDLQHRITLNEDNEEVREKQVLEIEERSKKIGKWNDRLKDELFLKNNEVESLTASISDHQDELHKIGDEYAEQTELYVEAHREREALSQQLYECGATCDELHADLVEVKKERDELRTDQAKLKDENTGLVEERERMQAETIRLQAEINILRTTGKRWVC